MRVIWWVGTVWMGLVRFTLCLWMFAGGGAGVWLACMEGLALFYGTVNLVVSRERDYSWGGFVVPACYFVGLLAVPRGIQVTQQGAFFISLGVLVSFGALLALRCRFTYGGSSWVDLCDRGPYRYVRHPQLLGRLLLLVGVGVGWETIEQVVRVASAVVLSVLVVVAEERALSTVPEYVDYRERVRFALVPGVV